MYYFTTEEKDILGALDADGLSSIERAEGEKAQYQRAAKIALGKTRSTNIRLSARNLERIKVLSAEKGLPYQTFITSLLHQYSNKKSTERTR